MPTYLITSPDGKKYKVTGPGTKEEALAQVQAQQNRPAQQFGREASAITQSFSQPKAETAPYAVEDAKGRYLQQMDGFKGGRGAALTEGSHAGLFGGFDDELAAGMLAPIDASIDMFKGQGFDMARAYARKQKMLDLQKSMRRAAYPGSSLAGEVAGGLALGGTVRAAPAVGASLPGAGAVPTLAGRVPAVLAAPAEGAAYGAVYGAGEAKPGERLQGAETGALTGATLGTLLHGGGKLVSKAFSKPAVAPAAGSDELASEGSALYEQMRKSGVVIKPEKIAHLKANISLSLGGTNADLAPKAFGLRRLANEILADGAPAHGDTVPINSLLRSTDRLKLAEADIAKGAGTRSAGPIQVSKSPDGRLLVVDGYHRLAEAAQAGRANIAVEHVPWTDTFSRVVANEKGRFLEPGPGVGELHNLAKSVNRILRSHMEGEDAHYVGLIKKQIENAIEGMTAADIRGGGTQAFKMWKDADALWAKHKKTAVIENILDSADVRTGQYTQSGLANTIRKEMDKLYTSIQKGRSKGWTADEIALIRQMAKGGSNSATINLLAKFAPRGVVSAIGGFALGGPALTLGGHIAGNMADKGALRAANTLRDAASRGYVHQAPRLPNHAMPLIPAGAAASTGIDQLLGMRR